MHRFNVLNGQLPVRQDRGGYVWRARRGVTSEFGLRWFGASVYELPDGQWTFPYHYHHGVEEWLYVVAGAPALRDVTGERVLAAGDLVCFPSGADGAHAVHGPGRVVMFSGVAAAGAASVSVYPDSDKLGVRPPGGGPDRLDFRRRDAVDYWDGE
ncbi:MAG: cupin domain-containing protein [Solirubrobacterales bacterium]|nr:cupin domain-containing protein [Solirubrobacterales bacterium]